jgi:exocyst complex component 2
LNFQLQNWLLCWLSGNLERIGIELGEHSSHNEGSYLPNGYAHEVEENALSDLGGGVTDPHQRLLIVLSNIGYCKDELSYELYDKYRHIWQHFRYIVIVNSVETFSF